MPILEIKNLTIDCRCTSIVKNINFTIESGDCLALIGESGSGKSVTSSAIGRLLPDNLTVRNGEINLLGTNMLTLNKRILQEYRGEKIAYIFQNYQDTFTPFIKIGKQMDEMLICHKKYGYKADRTEQIMTELENVGLDAKRIYQAYPIQLSGGQLQRAAIAQAMLLKPSLLIADEPTTALDSVSTSIVLDLIQEIKIKTKCAILFITHDLRCVQKYADKMAIMYKGEIVEYAGKEEIISKPKHIYTRNLFAAVPPLRNVPKRLPVLEMNDEIEEDSMKRSCCNE